MHTLVSNTKTFDGLHLHYYYVHGYGLKIVVDITANTEIPGDEHNLCTKDENDIK